MGLKIYSEGGSIVVDDGQEVHISDFSYYEEDGETISIVNNDKQAYSWNDLYSNIQTKAGVQAAATLQLTLDYLGGLSVGGSVPLNNFSGGFVDYNDLGTTGTPIVVTLATSPVLLTNDTSGSFTNELYLPNGVTSVWDSSSDVFDWSELKLGDMIDIRLDVNVITTSVNTAISIDLHLGTGGNSYTIPFEPEINFKSTGTHKINRFNGIYMGDNNTLNNGGQFKITSDKDCTVVVNGWYCKIIERVA